MCTGYVLRYLSSRFNSTGCFCKIEPADDDILTSNRPSSVGCAPLAPLFKCEHDFSSLPPEIWLSIMDLMDVKDTISLSQTSHRLHDLTEKYRHITLTINRVLLPYFHTEGNVHRFLDLLNEMAS